MSRFKCIVEYDGKKFCGWQSQPHRNTVQQCIETALQKIIKKKLKYLDLVGLTLVFMPLVRYFTLTTMVGYKALRF